MSERRVLTILVLLALAGAAYLWWQTTNKPVETKDSPQKAEAEERAKADPFPSSGDKK